MDFPRQHIAFGKQMIPLHYLCGYRSVSAGSDVTSKSILKFKRDDAVHGAASAEVALLALQDAGLRKDDVLVRALGHQETAVLWRSEPKPMDLLCRYIAEKSGCAYIPDLIRKKRKTDKLTGMTRAERENTMADAYELAPVFGWGDKRIWIMDDVVTTGATVRAIAAVLQKRYASVDLRAFCLGRTDGHSGYLTRGSVESEHYGWDAKRGWVIREEALAYGEGWLPEIGNLRCPKFGNEGTWIVEE